jgi:diguanylate cyclase (GGDEF)-like protein
MPIKKLKSSRSVWPKAYCWLLDCGWTAVVAVSLVVNTYVHRGEIGTIIQIFEPALWENSGTLQLTHGILWIIGLVGLHAGFAKLQHRSNKCNLATEELQRVNAILEDQASIDSLTGIYNRRKFLELLQQKIQESKRYGMLLALIFFDIDHFKLINDTYGHEAGDSVLQELAQLVTSKIRQTDIFARFGGEEFVILAHNDDIGAGCELAEKIRRDIHQHNFKLVGMVTCSFGVAQFLPGDTTDTIIKRADDAMYSAKRKGRNLVESNCDF